MCSVVSKQLPIPLVSLNFQFEVLSSATTCEWVNLSPVTTSPLDWLKFVHRAFRESHIHVILFCNCNLIGSTLSEPPEVNSLNPPILPGSFLTHAGRGNKPGDEVTQTQLEVFGDFFHDSCACLKVCWVTVQTI